MKKVNERSEIHEAIFYYSALVAHVVVGILVSFFDDFQRELMKEDLKKFFKKMKENKSVKKMFMPILFIFYYLVLFPFIVFGFLEELFSNDYRRKSLINEIRNIF